MDAASRQSGRPLLAPSVLAARDLIAWRAGTRKPPRSVPEGVLITHQASLFAALAPSFGRGRVRGLLADLRLLPGSEGRAGIAGRFGVGAPATAMLVEELAALGARRFLAVDVAASLGGQASGEVLVPALAVIGDGTSPHYLPGAESAPAAIDLHSRLLVALREAGVAASTAPVASTDAPFRETRALLDDFRKAGAAALDMETAALFAAASARGLDAAAVIVIGDTLADGWRPPADVASLRRRLLSVARIAARCLT